MLYHSDTVIKCMVHYIEAMYISRLIKIIVKFLECKIPERVLLTGAISNEKVIEGFPPV